MLLTPSVDGDINLEKEGISKDKIHMVGNVMIDSLFSNLERVKNSDVWGNYGIPEKYALLTLHRPSNVDDRGTFADIISALVEIGSRIDIVFPIHPRTRKMAEQFGLFKELESYQISQLLNRLDILIS